MAEIANLAAANLAAMQAAPEYQRAMLQTLKRELGNAPLAGPVIDFGAGLGDYARALQPQMDMICVEPDKAMRRHYPAELRNVAKLAVLPDHQAAAAYSLNVLEHIFEDGAALTRLARKVRPGGRIFLLVPAHQHLWTEMDYTVGHVRRYFPGRLRKLANLAGLSIVNQGSFDRVGYFATLAICGLSWLRKKDWSGDLTESSVRWFDWVFSRIDPWLRWLPFGKNIWITLQVPVDSGKS